MKKKKNEKATMDSFKVMEIKNLSIVNGGAAEAVVFTLNWDGWFDGSLFRRGNLNEFDK